MAPDVTVNAVVDPSPVPVLVLYVSVVAMFDFCIFLNSVAEVSYTSNTSSSAATSANSVPPINKLSKVSFFSEPAELSYTNNSSAPCKPELPCDVLLVITPLPIVATSNATPKNITNTVSPLAGAAVNVI